MRLKRRTWIWSSRRGGEHRVLLKGRYSSKGSSSTRTRAAHRRQKESAEAICPQPAKPCSDSQIVDRAKLHTRLARLARLAPTPRALSVPTKRGVCRDALHRGSSTFHWGIASRHGSWHWQLNYDGMGYGSVEIPSIQFTFRPSVHESEHQVRPAISRTSHAARYRPADIRSARPCPVTRNRDDPGKRGTLSSTTAFLTSVASPFTWQH